MNKSLDLSSRQKTWGRVNQVKCVDKTSLAYKLLRAKLFKVRMPIIVSWALTYKCNRKCKYCGAWKKEFKELETKEVFLLIDQIVDMGSNRIHFSGGEPLLRDDIEVILKYAKDKRISIALNSNGSFVAKRIKGLVNLDALTLSLDGPREIHDFIRGEGSYQEVIDAVELARGKNINTRFITVLSKININFVDFILKKATELKISVFFQPATELLLEGNEMNPIAPLGNEYTQVIDKLIKEKFKNRYIANSVSGLIHLRHWPKPKEIACVNSLIVCRIEPDGNLYGCADFKKISGLNCIERGFKNAFQNLVRVSCKECWCASFVELNCIFSWRFDSILNSLNLV